MMETVIIRNSLRELLPLIGGLVLFLFAAWFLLFTPPMESMKPRPIIYVGARWERLTGVIAILFSLFLAFFLFLAIRYPLLVIDEEGIHRPPNLTVPWSDVYGVTCQRGDDQALVIRVPKRQAYFNRKEYTIHLKDVSKETFEKACRAAQRR